MMKKETRTPEEMGEDLLAFEEWEEGGEEPRPGTASPVSPPPTVAVAEEPDEPSVDPSILAPDIPVQIVAVLAKRVISLKELMEFRMGQVVDLQRPPSETVDLVANGKLIARGELVEIDGKLGVRIVKLVR